MKLRSFLALSLAFVVSSFVSAQKPETAKPEPKAAAAPATTKLPTAAEIVEKYVKAIGGREAYMKHKSRVITGTMEFPSMGLKGTVDMYSATDDKMLTKVNLTGVGELLDGYDGKTAWTVNPIQGNRVKSGQELLQTKRLAIFNREVMFDKVYSKLAVKGTEKVGERNTYVLTASSEGLPDETLYFDTETGLLLRSDSTVISPEGQQNVKTFYDDYRDTVGIKTPHKTRTVAPTMEIVTTLTEIKHGAPVDETKFAQPK